LYNNAIKIAEAGCFPEEEAAAHGTGG